MPKMTKKEMQIQLALGTLSSMQLFLEMLPTQNKDTIESGDWPSNRNPKITAQGNGDIHIDIGDQFVFVFNLKEEFIGTFNYQQ